jgi:hypothetical protein
MKVYTIGMAALAMSAVLLGACGRAVEPLAEPTNTSLSDSVPNATTVETRVENSRFDYEQVSLRKLDGLAARDLAKFAVTGDDYQRPDAARRLRAMGPQGLAALEAEWAGDVECLRTVGSLHPDKALETILAFTESETAFDWEDKAVSEQAERFPAIHQQRLEQAFNIVTSQHDGLYSGLFWHEDLEAALLEARVTNRPIVSLRVLGRLDDAMC